MITTTVRCGWCPDPATRDRYFVAGEGDDEHGDSTAVCSSPECDTAAWLYIAANGRYGETEHLPARPGGTPIMYEETPPWTP